MTPETRAVVVTGATSGIGLALAETLAARGALVLGIGRDAARCAAAAARIRELSSEGRAEVLQADLSSSRETRRVAAEIKRAVSEQRAPLFALVNNAGVFSSYYVTTAEGFELQFAVNQLAPFLLTHLLMDALREATSACVVTVSSGSHHGARLRWDDLQLARRYSGLSAYRSTKLMNVLFTLELSRRLASQGVRAYAADPGLVATDLGFKGTGPFARTVWRWRKRQGRSPQEAALGLAALLGKTQDSAAGPYWRDGQPAQASRAALDPDAARRLWGELERMSGLDSGAFGLAR